MHEIVIIQWKLMHKQTKIVKIIKKGCINKHEIVTKVFWKKKKIKKRKKNGTNRNKNMSEEHKQKYGKKQKQNTRKMSLWKIYFFVVYSISLLSRTFHVWQYWNWKTQILLRQIPKWLKQCSC